LNAIPVETKNFNIRVTLPNHSKLLVKQERPQGIPGELWHEQTIRVLFDQWDDLKFIQTYLPHILHADKDNAILIFNYLDEYEDLDLFYRNSQDFSIEIAATLGASLSTIHRATFDKHLVRDWLLQSAQEMGMGKPFNSLQTLDAIAPEVFGSFPAEGFKFIALYQRYDSLGQAIAELEGAFTPCCLAHNDLRLCNILLHQNWEQQGERDRLRLIDWERAGWGDPAYDLGTLIASYLKLWLNSLVVSKALKLEESLRLATIPLEKLQPSIAALLRTYLAGFPEITGDRQDFLKRVVQFTGMALVSEILASIKYQKAFGNAGICMLQVAKSLVCRPEASLSTITGISFDNFQSNP
jgi:5-methylthioribose kinase